jgi:hypothetical protein
MDFLRIPFFDVVRDAKTVLLAGAGGGCDVYSAVPLYVGLRAAGKTVHLANLSFTSLHEILETFAAFSTLRQPKGALGLFSASAFLKMLLSKRLVERQTIRDVSRTHE